MGKINYENKVALNENPAIQNINKVTASDMNEIKESVNYIYDKGLFEVTPNEPTDEYIKLWIDNGEISPAYSEVVNSLDGNETTKAPSVQAVKKSIPKVIWEGQLSGGEEKALTLSNVKRFLKCYVSIPFEDSGVFVSGSFTIEINNSSKNIKDMTGSIVLDESDSQNHTNYYVIAAKYNIDTKKIYVSKAGFFNLTNGAWNDRLSSIIYAINRIETYD